MNTESLRNFCISLPGVTEDIKWEKDLCFSIGGKMFCVTGLVDQFAVGFKVREEDFDELTARDGVIPAPYLARYKWVNVYKDSALTKEEWEHFVSQSYELVKSKLPARVKKEIESSLK